MAFALLDGTNANIDISTTTGGSGASVGLSLKCHASQVQFTFRRPTTRKTTFCGNGWVGVFPTEKQMFAVVGGFMSKGSPLSDPLALMADSTSHPFVLTADTGCTVQGLWVQTEDANTLVAAANSARSLAFESDGAVTTTWVVA